MDIVCIIIHPHNAYLKSKQIHLISKYVRVPVALNIKKKQHDKWQLRYRGLLGNVFSDVPLRQRGHEWRAFPLFNVLACDPPAAAILQTLSPMLWDECR